MLYCNICCWCDCGQAMICQHKLPPALHAEI